MSRSCNRTILIAHTTCTFLPLILFSHQTKLAVTKMMYCKTVPCSLVSQLCQRSHNLYPLHSFLPLLHRRYRLLHPLHYCCTSELTVLSKMLQCAQTVSMTLVRWFVTYHKLRSWTAVNAVRSDLGMSHPHVCAMVNRVVSNFYTMLLCTHLTMASQQV